MTMLIKKTMIHQCEKLKEKGIKVRIHAKRVKKEIHSVFIININMLQFKEEKLLN